MSTGKTAVITGASAGIGRALAAEYASRGYDLGLVARGLPALETLRNEILASAAGRGRRVYLRAMDVAETATVADGIGALFDSLGSVDVVIVNAGVNSMTKVGKGQLEEQLDILRVNVLGAVATVDAAAHRLRAQGRGRIVGISSLAALGSVPQQAAYCASKAAFSMYLDGAREELRRHGVGVTTILPGFVDTGIIHDESFDMNQYPFVVSPAKAAREIAELVDAGAETAAVPAYPWKFLKPLIGNIPKPIIRLFKP